MLTVLPESLRFFEQYRLLIFGAVLVIMMIFKPEGLLPEKRKIYRFKSKSVPDAAQNTEGDRDA